MPGPRDSNGVKMVEAVEHPPRTAAKRPGVRQSSGAFGIADLHQCRLYPNPKSGGGPPHSKTLGGDFEATSNVIEKARQVPSPPVQRIPAHRFDIWFSAYFRKAGGTGANIFRVSPSTFALPANTLK